MKTLYLLRHAKAEPGGKALSDMERPLSARGREACMLIGEYMKRKKYMPALTLSSSSTRTQETFERVAQAADAELTHRFESKLYLATAEEVLSHVQGISDDVDSAMIIGHNPGMHHLSLLLASNEETELRHTLELKYPTGSLTVLRFKSQHWADIAQGTAELVDFITPGQL